MNKRIHDLRMELNLTMDEFGKRISSSKSSISNFENGNRVPTPQMIQLICKEFDVNEEWLRNGTGKMFAEIDRENKLMIWTAKVLKDETNSFKKRLLYILADLNENDWESLEKIFNLVHKND